MAGVFNPFGLSWQYSLGTASQASPTLMDYDWNPSFSGFTGDVAAACLYDATAPDPSRYAATGAVPLPCYPLPGLTAPASINTPPLLGVIVGFKYEPANNPIGQTDFLSYSANTQLKPGTGVTVRVVADMQGIYSIQYKGTTGLAVNNLFNSGGITCDTTYAVTIGGLVYNFPIGDTTTGYSKSYLYFTSADYSELPNVEYPAVIQGITNINGNTWSTTNPTVLAPNNLINVSLNNLLHGLHDVKLYTAP